MGSETKMETPAPFLSVYRPSWLWRAFALVFLAFDATFAFVIWREAILGLAEPRPKEMIIGAMLFLAGIGFVAHTFTVSVRFTIDTIEYTSLFSVKRLPLGNVRGRREYVAGGGEDGGTRSLKLESNDDRVPPLDFSKSYNFDDAFYKWFYSLPDLDRLDKEAPKPSNFGLV